jgi:hypothetical protein
MEYVSCGGSHTAAVDRDGALWVWGCSDGGRLGIAGITGTGDVDRPRLVESFLSNDIRIASVRRRRRVVCTLECHCVRSVASDTPLLRDLRQVSCGSAHTLALSVVEKLPDGEGEQRLRAIVRKGGYVFMAGGRRTLGIQCDSFTLCRPLQRMPCTMVSAG